MTGRSATTAGQASITYRVVTAGVPEAYGTWNISFSGANKSDFFTRTHLATHLAPSPSPTQTESGTERIVNGRVYDLSRVHGQMRWIQPPFPAYQSQDHQPAGYGGARWNATPGSRPPATR